MRKNKAIEAASDPRWQAARESELRGDFGEAARRYRELAQSPNDLGEDALFALGRVERRQGHAADALAAFEKYRDAYPDGAYARAADLHRLELLVESGDKPGALRESTRFLRQYPADPRAWKFRQTRSSLYAEQGDCERALADIAELAENEMTRSVERRCPERNAR
jgi:tetratricopeptide (TPR) repeat protein